MSKKRKLLSSKLDMVRVLLPFRNCSVTSEEVPVRGSAFFSKLPWKTSKKRCSLAGPMVPCYLPSSCLNEKLEPFDEINEPL